MDEILILQAQVMKALAHPRRLAILHELEREACEVGRLAETLGISQPSCSQHLAAMRASGIIEAERCGRETRYRLTDPEVMIACGIMRGVLSRRLVHLAGLSNEPLIPLLLNEVVS